MPEMKKAILLSIAVCGVLTTFAQPDTNPIVSYSGHYYAPNFDNVASQALKSQKVLDDQKAIDSIAKMRFDRYVNRAAYDSSLHQLNKMQASGANRSADVINDLKDYNTLQNGISAVIRSNETYRRYMYMLNCKIMMTLNEPWNKDQQKFEIQKTITDVTDFIHSRSLNDADLAHKYAELVKENNRLGSTKYTITLDPKLMKNVDLSKLEVYITDRNHYNVSKTRYSLSDAKQGVINNYAAHYRESGFLKEYFSGIRAIDGEPWFYDLNFGQQMHKKANTLVVSLSNVPEWYVYFFYKDNLYYYAAVPKCANASCEINIPYKM